MPGTALIGKNVGVSLRTTRKQLQAALGQARERFKLAQPALLLEASFVPNDHEGGTVLFFMTSFPCARYIRGVGKNPFTAGRAAGSV